MEGSGATQKKKTVSRDNHGQNGQKSMDKNAGQLLFLFFSSFLLVLAKSLFWWEDRALGYDSEI